MALEICIFKERLRFSDCSECDGRNYHCENYLASVPEYKPMMVRTQRRTKILPRNYQDWIRQWNDGGVV